MADNILRALISADGSQFTKTITQLEGQYKRFQEALKTATSVEGVARINRALDATKARMESLRSFNGFTPLNNQFTKMGQAAGSAYLALVNTGRVFQDLPFGIIGVTNNINPLIESFQRLKSETGSTGGAMKALVGSLSGAGGLGLAVSLITAAATFAVTGMSAFTRGLTGNKDAADEDRAALDKLGESIKDVKERVDGLSDSVSFLNKLGGINVEINKLPKLLDLQGESASNRQLIFDLVEEEKKAFQILADARALNNQKNTDDTKKAEENALSALGDVQKKIIEARQNQTILERGIALQRVKDQDDALAKTKAALDKENDLRDQQISNIKAAIARAKQIQEELRDSFEIPDPISDSVLSQFNDANLKLIKQKEDLVKRLKGIDVQEAFSGKDLSSEKDIVLRAIFQVDKELLQSDLDKAKKIIETFSKEASSGFFKVQIPVEFKLPTAEQKTGLQNELIRFGDTLRLKVLLQIDDASKKETEDKLKAQNERYLDIVKSGAIELASAIGEGIGSVLSGEGVKGLFGGIFNALGAGLKRLGTYLIGISKLIAGIKAALNSLNPAGALAIGIALVALGTVIQKSIPKFASGGRPQFGQFNIVGERGPELFVPDVPGRIVSNHDLGSIGGGMNVQVTGELVGRGQNLVAVISHVNKSNGRNF